ncbi:MAG: class I SAM-dependent methyltransferase [Gammaproteobacteria bacterium]|nr:class I SAM-dependent methyltransferase [Gammaproteobacteria bacterium]
MHTHTETTQSTGQVARTSTAGTPDPSAIKGRMKATWEDGDYAIFATFMEPGAVEILNGWQIPIGSRLLDIGCGAGQTAIPAAHQGMIVTGIDIADNLIEHAQERARYEGISVRFDVGDAEALPCDDNEFDVVISQIGAMFAPDPDRVASEMARVCKPAGRLHMANWTPGSFAATMFKCVSRYTPPPVGVPSPVLWGVEDIVEQRLGENFTSFRLERKYYPSWKYPFDTKQLVEFFRQHFGPVKRAFDALDDAGQKSLRAELEAIYAAHNIATDGTTQIRGEYLDVTATRE